MKATDALERNNSIWTSRAITCATVAATLLSYFWMPVSALQFVIDILLRAYLHFVAGAMAHEGVHGHLGNSRRANSWWTRIALIPTTVPAVTFRKTHLQHHFFTNVPGDDPDEFLNTKHAWEIPFRAFAMPHHWLMWLIKHKKFTRRDAVDYVLTYAAYFAIYGVIAYFVGIGRVLLGLLPAAGLHALLLWYAFAIKTHEGYITMSQESSSHNYYGRLMYWVSFGLSMHRLHHTKPQLGWLQMAKDVLPGTWRQVLRFERDIKLPV